MILVFHCKIKNMLQYRIATHGLWLNSLAKLTEISSRDTQRSDAVFLASLNKTRGLPLFHSLFLRPTSAIAVLCGNSWRIAGNKCQLTRGDSSLFPTPRPHAFSRRNAALRSVETRIRFMNERPPLRRFSWNAKQRNWPWDQTGIVRLSHLVWT